MRQNAPFSETIEQANTFGPYKFGAFDEYLSFCAIGGLITTDDGNISKMTTSQFCQHYGVDRKTTYRWRQTPGFANRVRARRDEIFPLARETACWNRLYLIGLQSNDLRAAVQALTLLLGHFGGLTLPARRQPESNNNGTSWTELIQKYQSEGLIDNDT